VAAPPPAGVRRRIERIRQKLVGWDKGSLTEQQTKGTLTTTIQIRRIHNTNSRTEPLSLPATAAQLRESSHNPVPLTGTQHDGTWYRTPCSVWPGWVSPPGCVPSWLLVKINPVLAEPRTDI